MATVEETGPGVVEIVEVASQGPAGPQGVDGSGVIPSVNYASDVFPLLGYTYDSDAGTITADGNRFLPMVSGEGPGPPNVGDKILVPFENSETYPGINDLYLVTNSGSDTEPWVMTRYASPNDGDLVNVISDYAVQGPQQWVKTSFGFYEPTAPYLGGAMFVNGTHDSDSVSMGAEFFNNTQNNPNGQGAQLFVQGSAYRPDPSDRNGNRFGAQFSTPDGSSAGIQFSPGGVVLQAGDNTYQLAPFSPEPVILTDDFTADNNDFFKGYVLNSDTDKTFDVGPPEYIDFLTIVGDAGNYFDFYNVGAGTWTISSFNVHNHLQGSLTVAPNEHKRAYIWRRDVDPDNHFLVESYWLVF
jgi:hypothetical protein